MQGMKRLNAYPDDPHFKVNFNLEVMCCWILPIPRQSTHERKHDVELHIIKLILVLPITAKRGVL